MTCLGAFLSFTSPCSLVEEGFQSRTLGDFSSSLREAQSKQTQISPGEESEERAAEIVDECSLSKSISATKVATEMLFKWTSWEGGESKAE